MTTLRSLEYLAAVDRLLECPGKGRKVRCLVPLGTGGVRYAAGTVLICDEVYEVAGKRWLSVRALGDKSRGLMDVDSAQVELVAGG